MALSYGFFDAELTPSGQYDRAYAAEQFAEYFHLIVSNGVFPDPATQLQVVASDTPNMNVNVSDGYGWINGYYAKNSGPYPLAIQAASGTLNRIDAVVLRWVNASRSMELAVKTGIAASAPTVPALQRDTDVYELMLATVTVAAGATSIPQSSITDKRSDTSVCGWVTGAVQNIDTTNLFAQYDTAFQEWFDNIKSQLSGDVATNLQNQIDKNAAGIATINATTLKADTKTALGLPASAGPDDAFKVLAHVGNLHVWERVKTYADPVPEVPAGYTLGETLNKVVLYTNYNSDDAYRSITCYESLTVAKDGTISGANSSSHTIYYSRSNSTLPSSIGGKFLYENPGTGHTNAKYTDQWWYIPTDVEILTGTGDTSDGESSTRWMGYSKLQKVTGYPYTPAIPAGTTIDYLTSTDRNAYTDGTVDSTTITYLGQLGEPGAKIEVVSYVGTGTYGQSNPCSVTADFPIKVLLVVGLSMQATYNFAMVASKLTESYAKDKGFIVNQNSGYGNYGKKSSDGKTFYWYNAKMASAGLNESGVTYTFIAIG